MIPHLLKGFTAAYDRHMRSPFRRKHYDGALDVEAIEWAISLLQMHDGVTSNPNSQYWLDRLRANLRNYSRPLPNLRRDIAIKLQTSQFGAALSTEEINIIIAALRNGN